MEAQTLQKRKRHFWFPGDWSDTHMMYLNRRCFEDDSAISSFDPLLC